MSEPNPKPANRRRQFSLDDRSQSTALLHLLVLLAATGAATAVLAYVLSRAGVLGTAALGDAFPAVLAGLAGCFVLAGLVAVPVVMRLTHRYVGPAYVMRRALKGMRLGDYGCRLTLRQTDFLHDLAEEINAHRSDLARRDLERQRLLTRLDQLLRAGDFDDARALLTERLDVPARRDRRSG